MFDSLSYDNFFYDIESTNDNGFVLCGDASPSGEEQYWIIKTDSVGCYNQNCTFVDVTSVKEVGEKIDLLVYPNPATTSITLTLQKGEGKATIYNMLGEILLTTKIIQLQTEIDIGNLPKGLYFVEVESYKGIMRKKFVKE